MRLSVRGLDDVFTYPCTKADVREAFGDVLESASFGLNADHSFSRREESIEIPGRVLVTVSVSTRRWPRDEPARQKASFYAYRVRKSEWSDFLHWQVREILREKIHPWVEAMVARPEIEWGPHEERIIELRDGVLHIHARRSRRYYT